MFIKREIAKSLMVDLASLEKNFQSRLTFEETILNSIAKTEKKFGDYTSKLSFHLSPLLAQKPYLVALTIEKLIKKNPHFIKIEVVPPGFINLTLNQSWKKSFLKYLLENDLKKIPHEKTQKILIEYVSANPTGPLHIGHGRWGIVGNVLINLFQYAGHEVEGEFYINDTGKQITNLLNSVEAIRNNAPIPEQGYSGDYLEKYKDNDVEVVADIIKEQKETLKKINVHHDRFFSEKTLYLENKIEKTLKYLIDNDLAYRQDNALWFRSTLEQDEKDRVLVKSDGSYTYFAVDIAYHYDKIKRGYDVLVDVLGADHHGYVDRIKGAVKILSQGKVNLVVLIGQHVFLKKDSQAIKMSKRDGTLITLEALINEIPTEVIKYFFSMKSINSPLEFDLGEAQKESPENPIYYIQYAHARICSVLRKAEKENFKMASPNEIKDDFFEKTSLNEIVVHLMEFESEILGITHHFEFHKLNNYLYTLAKLFHKLYNEVPFLNKTNRQSLEFSESLLLVLNLIKKVLAKGLKLLSIEAKSKM